MLTITDVETFHRTFGHPIKTSKEYLSHFATPEIGNDDNPVLPECGTNPDLRLRRLRTDLILEECKELDHACNMDADDTASFLQDSVWDVVLKLSADAITVEQAFRDVVASTVSVEAVKLNNDERDEDVQ